MSSGGITNSNHSGNNQNTWKEYLETVEADGINEDAADDADSGTMMDNDAIREANTGIIGRVDDSTTTQPAPLSSSDEPSAFQSFYEDQSMIRAEDKKAYLLMCARGIVEGIPAELDISKVGPPFDEALSLKIIKKAPITITKNMVSMEIKRRNPRRKNADRNNKKLPALFDILVKEEPLSSLSNVVFINRETKAYIEELNEAIREKASAAGAGTSSDGGSSRQTYKDRLRYICAFENEHHNDAVRLAYTRSQDTLSRTELDARRSAMAVDDFHELITQQFNDSSWTPTTRVVPSLHTDFEEPIDIPKRSDYDMNIERSKALILSYKSKLETILRNYNRSGNGSCQLETDEDGNVVGDFTQYGHFDLDKAQQVGGDDGASFLNNEPVDLLYCWDTFDQLGLLHFTTAKLRGPNAVNSDSIPSKTTYSARSATKRPRAIDVANEDNNSAALSAWNQGSFTKKMGMMGEAMVEMNRIGKQSSLNSKESNMIELEREINKKRERIFELEMQLEDEHNNERKQIIIKRRIASLQEEAKEQEAKKQWMEAKIGELQDEIDGGNDDE